MKGEVDEFEDGAAVDDAGEAGAGLDDELTVELPDDSSTMRHLRRELKQRTRELRQLQETVVSADERAELDELRAAVDEFRQAEQQSRREAIYDEAGVPEGLRRLLDDKVDPESASADGLREWMQQNQIAIVDPVAEQRSEAARNIASLRRQAEPVGQRRMSYQQYEALKGANPQEAIRALARGEVDRPPWMEREIMAGRQEDRGIYE